MDVSGYRSEFRNYKQFNLGERDKLVMKVLIMSPMTAYRMWRFLNGRNKIAYPNVRKKFLRLEQMGLIKKLGGHFDRDAKPYVLTNLGWFYCIHNDYFLFEHYFLLRGRPDATTIEDDNLFITELLQPYFAMETLRLLENNTQLDVAIVHYLQECCRIIKDNIEEQSNANISLTAWKHKPRERLKILDNSLAVQLKVAAWKMIFHCAAITMIIDRPIKEMMNDPELYEAFGFSDKPKQFVPAAQILSSDKRFMEKLERVSQYFLTGYKTILSNAEFPMPGYLSLVKSTLPRIS